MIRHLFLFLLALFAVASAQAVATINSVTHVNYTGYVIAADALMGAPGTNRDAIIVEAEVGFGVGGSYRLEWSLLDPAGTVMASATTPAAFHSFVDTIQASLTPSAVNRLVPGTNYRVKVDVIRDATNVTEDTATEPVGKKYIHFIGTTSSSGDLNVVSEVTAVTINRSYLLEANAGLQTIPVRVDYTVHRFDDWAGSNTPKSVNLTFGGQWLRHSDGAAQSVTVSANTKTEASVPSFDASGFPIAPAVVTGFKIIQVDPAAILSPISYRASVTIEHEENTTLSTTYTGNTMDSAAAQFFHFSGVLTFGSSPVLPTHFTALDVTPVLTYTIPPSGIAVTCQITPTAGTGTVDGVSGYTYGGSVLEVSLHGTTGDAAISGTLPGSTNLVPATVADRNGVLNGVDFKRTGTATLDASGAHSAILATLPAGIGWATDKVTGLLDSTVDFGTRDLDAALKPSGTLTITPGAGAFHLCEETKPVYIEAAVFSWVTTTGEFQCGAASGAHSIRKPLMDYLQSFTYADPEMLVKRSNDHSYNFVSAAANITVKKGLSGGAEMSGDLTFNGGAFLSHFPHNTPVVWTAASVMHLANDLVNPVGSQLNTPGVLLNVYNQHCPDEADCTGTQIETVSLTPSTTYLNFTGDGGVYAAGTVTQTIEWGYNGSTFTHQVLTSFTDAHFLMAGTFLRGDQNLLSDEDGPANILLSGFDPANLTVAERPQTAAYTAGLGDYAGMNFRCSAFTSPLATASSRLQGTVVGPYDLTTRSKYYTRRSGVTGIHESPTGPGNLTLAGYLFDLDTFGFSFLSNEMEDSRTSGVLDIITPNNFTLDFNELRFTCLGSLESFELGSGSTGTDSKEFDLWNGLFTPLAVSFHDSSACVPASTPGSVTMILGFSAHASHFAEPFEGSLGIEYTGHFAKYSAHTDLAVPTRLTLPSALTMTGASGEEYAFFPAEGAYFNDNPAGDGEGFWNLFGTLDVPFFEDMRVHLQARAGFTSTGSTAPEVTSPLYMTGGWTDGGGDTAFDVAYFDGTHFGRPAVALATYRDQTATTYLPHAEKLWLGVVDLDYPVVWSSTSFDFRGFEAQTKDLLVINTEHQLDFMDEENAEISFGVQYSGLPEINLTNMAFNAIDEATGVSSAFVSAAGNDIFNSLTGGVDSFTDMLSDKAEDMIGDLLDQALEPVLASFLNDVKTNTPSGGKIDPLVLSGLVDTYFRNPSSQAVNALKSVSSATALTKRMIADFDAKLAQIEEAIDAVTTGLNTDGDPEIDSYGLLAKYVPAGESEAQREIFITLASALIDTLGTAISSSEVGDKIRDVLAEIEPQLDAAQEVLVQIKTAIGEVRTALGTTGELTNELNAIVSAATAQIEAASDAAGDYAEDLVLAMTVEDQPDIDAIIEEWKAQIAQKITDEIFESQFVADIQEAIKERVYDLQGAFNQAVDTAFAALNSLIRQAMSEALAGIDEAINDNFLGDVQAYLGSGSLVGYAHINGDSLDELRIDATFKMEVPDAMELAAYLQIKELDSDGAENAACCGGASGANVTEVTIGALDVGLGWTGVSGEELRADLGVKFALDGSGAPIGLGGSFEMTSGEISFETFKITELGASVMFGATENYLAAKIGVEFGEYQMAGGIFFGHACNLEPLEMVDPLVASVLTMDSFTGVYCYGEATFPVYGTGTCIFNISAKAGAGVFYFTAGPTYAGRLTIGVYGEALCAVEIGGEVSLVGLKSGDEYAFAGSGRLYGKVGVCKFCLEADLRAQFEYTDQGGWEVDY
ncbi:MAG: hypothetical protein IPK22_14925 [Verrucomicrobiaceae bacterium]|nr:hypothetical protein [Verrucomicrobiaceae bacterium]